MSKLFYDNIDMKYIKKKSFRSGFYLGILYSLVSVAIGYWFVHS